MDPTSLMMSVFFGAFGFGYFIYGRKQAKFIPMVSGIALAVFPLFVSDLWLQLFIGIGLLILPWVARF